MPVGHLGADDREPEGTPALSRVSPLVQSVYLREQAGRCRRLARDSTDPALRDSLLKLADEYAARASAQETEAAARRAGLDQDGA